MRKIPLSLIAMLASLPLAGCLHAPDPELQVTGSAILARELPSEVDRVVFDTESSPSGFVVGQFCQVHYTGRVQPFLAGIAQDDGYVTPDYGPPADVMFWGQTPAGMFHLEADRVNGVWVLGQTDISPDGLSSAAFEASVHGCSMAARKAHAEKVAASPTTPNRASWAAVPTAPASGATSDSTPSAATPLDPVALFPSSPGLFFFSSSPGLSSTSLPSSLASR